MISQAHHGHDEDGRNREERRRNVSEKRLRLKGRRDTP